MTLAKYDGLNIGVIFHQRRLSSKGTSCLAEEMLAYALHKLHTFLLNTNFDDSILNKYLVYSNVLSSASLDNFLIEENHKIFQLQHHKTFQEVQQKTLKHDRPQDICS